MEVPKGASLADPGGRQATVESADRAAPKWRHKKPGLCLEGECKNVKCRAHRSMVITNQGFIDFELRPQFNRCFCALCRKPAAPLQPGFKNCFWRVKAVSFHTKEELVTHWIKTEKEYFTFDVDACRPTSLLTLLQLPLIRGGNAMRAYCYSTASYPWTF